MSGTTRSAAGVRVEGCTINIIVSVPVPLRDAAYVNAVITGG
jgi:adenosylcobinamide amidohydrolase